MKNRTVKILKWLGIVIIALTAVYLVLLMGANRHVKNAYAALEADGRPLTRAEIIPPAIPGPDNAALVYEQVVLKLKAEPAGTTNLWSVLGEAAAGVITDTPQPGAVETFQKWFEQPVTAESLAELAAGSRKKGYWNDLDYDLGISLELPHIQDLLTLSRVLCAGARVQDAGGDPTAARDSVLTALRVANALETEPILVSQLVRGAQFSMAADTLHDLSYLPGSSQSFDPLLRKFESPDPFVRAIDGERIFFGDWAFNALSGRDIKIVSEVTGEGGMGALANVYGLLTPMLRRDHAAHMTVMHTGVQRMLEPFEVDGKHSMENEMLEIPWYCPLTRMLAPSVNHCRVEMIEMSARARVTRAGLEILEHHATEGAWPEALPAGGNWMDPFSGKALVYRPEAKGFVLYSVGQDGVDDQGAREKNDKGDIVWEISTVDQEK